MAVNTMMPKTLKFTQKSVDCVRQTISFIIAMRKKKATNLRVKTFHPEWDIFQALPINNFKRFLLKTSPNISANAKNN